jgi:hypothetical protein
MSNRSLKTRDPRDVGRTGKARFAKMTPDQYHADRTAISRSMLWTFRERRRLYEAEFVIGDAPPERSTKKMDIGSLAHVGLLEPHNLAKRYAVIPERYLARNGAESTNDAAAFRALHESRGQIVLKQNDFDTVCRMIESVQAEIGEWLHLQSLREQPVFWTNPETGLPCKCLIDWLLLPGSSAVVLDFKTTENSAPASFRYRAEEHGYWLQDPHYREGAQLVTGLPVEFYFVVVEAKFPYATTLHRLKPRDLGQATAARLRLLKDLKQCLANGDFAEPWQGQINELELRPSCFGP